jgi:hypothetical protein
MDLRDVDEVEGVPLLDEEESPTLEQFDLEEKITSNHDDRRKFWNVIKRAQLFRILEWKNPRWDSESAKQVALRFLVFFIPSFLRHNPDKNKALHETAYLDGMRGFACYCVFFAHYTTAYCSEVRHPYGEGPNLNFVQTNYFFQLPILRLLFNGQAAVTVFYVLSGYVLSYKPLKLIHAHDWEKLQGCLASSIFRRWWRFDWFDAFRVDNPNMPPGVIGMLAEH